MPFDDLIISSRCCSLINFGYTISELEKLNDKTTSNQELQRQTTAFRRMRNWFLRVDKADATKAYYGMVHSETAQEAYYYFVRFKSCLGDGYKNRVLIEQGIDGYNFEVFLENKIRFPIKQNTQWTNNYTLNEPKPNQADEHQPLLNNGLPIIGPVRDASFRSQLAELDMSWHWLQFMTKHDHPVPGSAITLNKFLQMNFNELEHDHDFIQVLFPNPKSSPVNRQAPLYSELIYDAIHQDAAMQTQIKENLDVMLKFYGLVRTGNNIQTDPSNTPQAKSKWLKNDDHNHKRLSRILIFLYNTGFNDCANSLKRCITTEGDKVVKERNLQIWNGLVSKRDVIPLVFT